MVRENLGGESENSFAPRRPSAPLEDQGTAGRGPRLETFEPFRERCGRPTGEWVTDVLGVDFLALPLGGVTLGLGTLPLDGVVILLVVFGLVLGMETEALEAFAFDFLVDAAGEIPVNAAGLRGGVNERIL